MELSLPVSILSASLLILSRPPASHILSRLPHSLLSAPLLPPHRTAPATPLLPLRSPLTRVRSAAHGEQQRGGASWGAAASRRGPSTRCVVASRRCGSLTPPPPLPSPPLGGGGEGKRWRIGWERRRPAEGARRRRGADLPSSLRGDGEEDTTAAGCPPRESDDFVMDSNLPRILMKPIPLSVVKFVRDYDISSIGKMLLARDGRSFEEKVETFNKDLESFRKPRADGALLDEDFVDFESDEDGEDGEDDEELMGDEKKPAGDLELQTPNESETECKNQDYQKASDQCQGQEKKAKETNNSR